MVKHSPTTARSSASLRSSPLYVGLRCVASLRRSGLNFLFYATPGFRGFAAPPPGYFIAPLRGSNLGSLALAIYSPNSDLSSSLQSTKKQTERSMKKREIWCGNQGCGSLNLFLTASQSVWRSRLTRFLYQNSWCPYVSSRNSFSASSTLQPS